MKLRRLGNSDLEITPIILGTWALGGWLWWGTSKNRPTETIQTSIEEGINCIDTAPVYGFGLSEEEVGKAIKGYRNKLIIATKCGLVWDDRPGATKFFETRDNKGYDIDVSFCLRKKSILQECDESLQRLEIDEIDLYQCHWPDPTTPIDEAIEAFIELKDKGKIREFGISNFSAEQTAELVDKGASPLTNQVKYSFLSRETGKEDIPYCREHNIGVIAYSPMEMGLLAGKITMDTQFSDDDTRADSPWFQPENRKKALDALESLRGMSDKYNATMGQLILAATTEVPGITVAIAGARTPEQAITNAGAGRLNLSEEDIKQIIKTFGDLQL
jgi:aryl-alcohol dehydrogenase-like predicted oxidoreductase